jgi:glycosyltransferase involved in cell wall biosynthesis
VVNAVGAGSIPAEIATAVTRHTDHTVDILTWFDSGSFAGEDTITVDTVDAPDTALGIDWATYHRAVDHLDGYDIVQAHHNHSGAFAKVIARRLGIPVVSREGNTRDGFTRKGRVANGLTNPLARRVVCISESVYASFSPWERTILPQQRVTMIPNGVHLKRIDATEPILPEGVPSDEDAFLVGNAAMLYEQKAQDTLIRAVSKLNSQVNRPIELVICGDGPERERLESLTERAGISERVHFLGLVERETVYATCKAVDAFAMPSRWEGFCSAVAEALATGTPTVLSDIDVFHELYGKTVLYHGVDEVSELTKALETLVNSKQERARLAQAGRKLVEERYTIEAVASEYATLYESIVDA